MSLKYYIEKFLSVNLKDYSNIGIDLEINKILFFLAVALTLGAIGLYIHGKKVALLFKRMIRLEVFGRDGAKNLSDLGLGDNKAIRRLVTNRAGYLKKCIKILGDERMTFEEYAEEKNRKERGEEKESNAELIDIADTESNIAVKEGETPCLNTYLSDGLISPDAKIYIPETSRDFALKILDNDSGSAAKLIVSCAIILGICSVLILFMPDILAGLNSLLGN